MIILLLLKTHLIKKRIINRINNVQGSTEEEHNNEVSYDLSISVLGGVSGIKLTEENFEDPSIFENLAPEDKSSRFWIQTEFLQQPIESDKKLWDTEFLKEEESGKTDFKLSFRHLLLMNGQENLNKVDEKSEAKEETKQDTPEGEENKESEENVEKEKKKAIEVQKINYSHSIYESLLDGLWIELYEEYPVLRETENEEGDKITRVDLIDDKPVFKRAIRGVTRLNTEKWILNPNLNDADMIIHNKFYFYKLKYKSIPEFFYENHNVKMKPSEIEAIDSYVASKREKMAQIEAEEKEKAAAEKVFSSG